MLEELLQSVRGSSATLPLGILGALFLVTLLVSFRSSVAGCLRHVGFRLGGEREGRDRRVSVDRSGSFPGVAWRAWRRLVGLASNWTTLAAAYSDSLLKSLYPTTRAITEDGEPVEAAEEAESARSSSWYRSWYSAASRWTVWGWRLARGSERPQIYCQPGSYADALQQQCPSLHLDYSPPFWARNRHVHLISSVTLRKPFINPKYNRQLVTCKDGGSFALDWFHASNQNTTTIVKDAPCLLVVHALTGDAQDSYVKWMCNAAHSMRWRAVAFNFRGCGDVKLTTPRPFHQPADTEDIHTAITHIRKAYPNAPIFAVGFSLGAYTLNKYVGEVDSGVFSPDGRLDGCACLGSGYDFSAEMANCGRSRMGTQYLSAINAYWKGYLKEHAEMLQKHPDIQYAAAKRAPTMQDFDRAVFCPVFGYKDVEECYDASNGLRWIGKISTPTMLVSAQDDPFLDSRVMPIKECKASEHVLFVLTKFGSHCGHMQGWWPLGQSWLDVIVIEFFKAILLKTKNFHPTASVAHKDIGKDLNAQMQNAAKGNE